MVGRPRTVSEADILVGAARAMIQHGPARLTLAIVANAVGLAPATLVQRFGSKRGLLLALARQSVATTPQRFAQAYARGGSPSGTLVDVLVEHDALDHDTRGTGEYTRFSAVRTGRSSVSPVRARSGARHARGNLDIAGRGGRTG